MTNEKGITYFSIPGEVAFNPSLNYTDLRVWWEANLLDTSPRHCYASNNRIAYVLGISRDCRKRLGHAFHKKTNIQT